MMDKGEKKLTFAIFNFNPGKKKKKLEKLVLLVDFHEI